MNHIVIQLGSNIGDKYKNLSGAIDRLISNYCTIIEKSSIYETEAWGKTDQDSFYNQLISIETKLSPYALLRLCQSIENEMGRKREIHWGPRIIDLDIIFYRNKIIFSPELEIPHPHFRDRKFILKPLSEMFPKFIDPFYGVGIKEILETCKDESEVKRIEI